MICCTFYSSQNLAYQQKTIHRLLSPEKVREPRRSAPQTAERSAYKLLYVSGTPTYNDRVRERTMRELLISCYAMAGWTAHELPDG